MFLRKQNQKPFAKNYFRNRSENKELCQIDSILLQSLLNWYALVLKVVERCQTADKKFFQYQVDNLDNDWFFSTVCAKHK